ncbi:homeodomain-like protein [Tanacetum coccineum]
MEETLSKSMSESVKRHEETSNMIKEIRASTDAAERGFGSQPSSTKSNPKDHVKSISTTAEADSNPIRHIRLPQYAEKDPGSFTLPCYINNVSFDNSLADLGASVSVMPLSTYLNLDFIILDMPEEVKVPLILGRPFLTTAHAKIDVFNRKITLRVRDEKIIFKSVKPDSSLIKRVYMLSLRERIELDLEARLMGETLVLNRSLDPLYGDYIELNDLNVPLELRSDQVDDLMPTIEEGKDKLEYKGNNVVGALINIPILVGTFSILTDFVVLEDMDAYRDERIGDVSFGKPFLREVRINAKWFKEMITIHNGNEEVTYQMVRSHPRFKHHTNQQCNKIPPLLKVSEEDKMNGTSHSYQKLKGFYKGVLNLGPEYFQDAKIKEWLIRGHISVHEME